MVGRMGVTELEARSLSGLTDRSEGNMAESSFTAVDQRYVRQLHMILDRWQSATD